MTSPPTMRQVSPTSARRFARRQWSRRLLTLRPLLVLSGLVIATGVTVWVVAFSSVLDVRAVSVAGLTPVSGLTEAEVRDVAGVPPGLPLARVDLDAVHDRVVSRLLPVKDVTVARSWPHEVRIEITERTPVAVWRDGVVRRLVDAEGVAFRTADGSGSGSGPQVVELRLRSSGVDAEQADELRLAGAEVAAALPTPLREQVMRVRVQTVDSVTLRMRRGVTVMWGSAEESEEKARVLQALLKRPAKVYDVSVPGFPTTRA